MKSRFVQMLFLTGLSLALVGGYLVWRGGHGPLAATRQASLSTGVTQLDDERPLPHFSLRSPRGEVSEKNLLGHWTFLFFGYTQCPDVCPGTLSALAQTEKTLARSLAAKELPALLFVSVDPQRDTMELLAHYVPAFDPAFVGATGSDAELAPLVKHLGVFYKRYDDSDKRHYLVDHTAALYLIDPQGRLKAVFSPPHDPAQIAKDFLILSRG